MPGTFRPPSVGARALTAQRIMDRVYEKARSKGYSRARAAKIGWGAVHRAGYDPGRLLNPERLGFRYSSRVYGHARRAVAGIRRIMPRRRATRPTRPTAKPRARISTHAEPPPDPRLYADPARLPKPHDIAGYDNLNNIRLVEKADAPGYYPVKRLVEGQIVLPQHQWGELYDQVKKWPDIELTDENGDGKVDRIIRRGRRNSQTNLFVDSA
jgi:hypothetical protein